VNKAPSPTAIIRHRITFFGRVQGVGFRATARHIARSFAVTGWVRNEEDGSVQMEIQGTSAEVADCLTRLRVRMQDNITRDAVLELTPLDDEGEFEIRR
jgi:acylphosphatase